MGSILGWRIAQSRNALVSVVCRSNYNQVNDNGYLIQTSTWGSGHFRPSKVYRAGSLSGLRTKPRFDYVICANKITADSGSVIEDIEPLVRSNTTLVTAQNGMDVEKPLRKEFSHNTILSAVCNIGINQQYPGFIEQTARIRKKAFLIGIPSPSSQGAETDRQRRDALSAMDEQFDSVTSADDMEKERWTKLVFNAAWNAMCAILNLNTHQVLCRPDAVEIVRELAHEAYGVALRSGVELDEDIPNRTVELAKSSAPITPSTLQDVNKQRPMELGPIFGKSRRRSHECDLQISDQPSRLSGSSGSKSQHACPMPDNDLRPPSATKRSHCVSAFSSWIVITRSSGGRNNRRKLRRHTGTPFRDTRQFTVCMNQSVDFQRTQHSMQSIRPSLRSLILQLHAEMQIRVQYA